MERVVLTTALGWVVVAGALAQTPSSVPVQPTLQTTPLEASVGGVILPASRMSFRLTLRDAIYSSEHRNNRGILEHPITKLRRGPVYQEILQYSYQDYLQQFLIPYYWCRGMELAEPGTLAKAGSLRTYAAGLQARPDIRLIVNRNDFLLPEEDLTWRKATFADRQLTVFEQGGHLGNLSHPAVQKAILEALEGLRTPHKRDRPTRTRTQE